MAHRTFRDSSGRVWEVWPVTVEYIERRLEPSAGPPSGSDRRRRPAFFRPQVSEPWTGGWLAFETRGEKRRLAPFPADWEDKNDAELEALCANAISVPAPRRLIE
jgi:hypothetical protein